jgi:GNAT superfamily N-acetyltransferase
MELSAKPVTLPEILPWRDLYRRQMNCQIVHDSLHPREGWTESYLFEIGGAKAGYGAIVIGGPWKGTRTVFEFYVLPEYQSRAFHLFDCLLTASTATAINVQTNDAMFTVMLHAYAHNIVSESILFEDKIATGLTAHGATFNPVRREDSEWGVEVDGAVVANGGIMFHYNRPYGDIYMRVEEPFRRRGLGSYLVQELKKVCYQMGSIPAARCNPDNIASRRTLQKAGFVPCAHILTGSLLRPAEGSAES